jgi:LacI family transcriptional regulator
MNESEGKKPNNSRRRVTLADVARRVGVSVPAASFALSGKGKTVALSDDLIRRIHEAADVLDYSPNLLVRNLQTGRTGILTFFNALRHVPPFSDFYSLKFTTAAHRLAGRLAYNILTICSFPEGVDETYHMLNGGHSDGIILYAADAGEPLLLRFRSSSLPVVLMNTEDSHAILSSVRDDVEDGMRQVAERMYELGHRRIAVLTSSGSFPNAPERIALLRRFAAEHGMELPDNRIAAVSFIQHEVDDAIDRLMSMDDPPTALFCWQDETARMAVASCQRLEVDVPGRLSIVGYDGVISLPDPQAVLATVHVDLDRCAARCVEILHDLIVGAAVAPVIEKLPVLLVEGTTLGAAKES